MCGFTMVNATAGRFGAEVIGFDAGGANEKHKFPRIHEAFFT